MKKIRTNHLYVFMGFLLSASILKGNSELNNPVGWNLNELKRLQTIPVKTAHIASGGDLVIGQNNPDEVKRLCGLLPRGDNLLGKVLMEIRNELFPK